MLVEGVKDTKKRFVESRPLWTSGGGRIIMRSGRTTGEGAIKGPGRKIRGEQKKEKGKKQAAVAGFQKRF